MEIRPGDFGTNLNTWFQLLGRQWRQLLVTSLVAYAPLAVAVTILYLVADLGGTFTQLADPAIAERSFSELLEILIPFLLVGLIGIVLQVIATAFVYLAAARLVAQDFAEIETDWRHAGRFAVGLMGTAIGAALLVLAVSLSAMGLVTAISWALIANLGTTFVSVFLAAVVVLASVVILIWLSVSISLYSQSIALSRTGAVSSITESFHLVRGRWWVTVGFLLVTSLIASLALQLLNIGLLPLYVAGAAVPETLAVLAALTTLIQGPVVAAIAAAYAIWYVDLKARRETLDAQDLIV